MWQNWLDLQLLYSLFMIAVLQENKIFSKKIFWTKIRRSNKENAIDRNLLEINKKYVFQKRVWSTHCIERIQGLKNKYGRILQL